MKTLQPKLKLLPKKLLTKKQSSALSKKEQEEFRQLVLQLAEVNTILSKRQEIDPLSFFRHLPFPELFHACVSKIKGLFGGNRSGKTQEGAEYVISKCREKANQRWWACAETFNDSVNIMQRKVHSMLPKKGMRYCHYDEVNGFRHRKIIFENGSTITFKSYDQKREAFQGDDIDGIWNDEEPPYDIYKEQKMRLIDRDGEMIFTLTALKGVTELIGDLFDDHEVIKSEYSELVQEELPRIIDKNGARFFMLWTTENPHISQKRLLGDIKFMSRGEIKSRIHGIPTNLQGRIYPTFNRRIHVVSASDLPTRLVTLYHVLDPHDRKPWAMSWWAVDKRNTAYCVREYPWGKNFNDMDSDDKSYDEYAKVIHDMEDELFQMFGRVVYKRIIDPNFGNATVQLAKRIDGNSKTTPIKELRKLGFNFEDGYDDIESGHLQVRKALHYVEKNGVIVHQPKCYFLEDCENSIRHHSKYSHKDLQGADGDDKPKPQLTQKYKDFCDLSRYLFMAGAVYVERKPRELPPVVKRY